MPVITNVGNAASGRPIFTLDKADYIAAIAAWDRPVILSELHRVGLKQGKIPRSNEELAELLWYATAPTRERNRAKWTAVHD